MTLIVDASVIGAMAAEEPLGPIAEAALRGEALVAPDLILAELGNLLWKKVRRGAMTPADAEHALRRSVMLLPRIVPMLSLQDAALALSLRRDHPAYDAFYVALAQREAAPLVTADARLATVFGNDVEIRLLQPSSA